MVPEPTGAGQPRLQHSGYDFAARQRDREALYKALRELVRRHEILRTSFSYAGGEPVQVVMPGAEVALAELDLTELPRAEQQREWARVIREQSQHPGFRPVQDSLVSRRRGALLADEHKLLLTIHHIIADEWSMGLIQKEVTELYRAFLQGLPSPLPELPVQYADFARWQRERVQGAMLEQQLAYWKEELAGAPHVLELRTDRPRPAVQTFMAETGASASRGCFSTTEVAGQTGTGDVVHGAAGQLHGVSESLLPAGRHPGGDSDFPAHACGNRKADRLLPQYSDPAGSVLRRFEFPVAVAAGAGTGTEHAHADLPLRTWWRSWRRSAIPAGRRCSRRPSCCTIRTVTEEVSKASGHHELENGTSKFDLTLVLSETESGLEGLIEYSTDLFDSGTIQRMAKNYGTMLEGIANNPDQAVAALPLLTKAERHELLVDWNTTGVEFSEAGGRCMNGLKRR